MPERKSIQTICHHKIVRLEPHRYGYHAIDGRDKVIFSIDTGTWTIFDKDGMYFKDVE